MNADGAVLHDRRRPGRTEVDPALIPLLRGQGPVVADDDRDVAEVRDDLGSAVGIARGVGAMCVMWAAAAAIYVLS